MRIEPLRAVLVVAGLVVAGLAVPLSLATGTARAQSMILSQTPIVTLTASPDPAAAGDSVTLTASVTTREGGAVPGGRIQFIDQNTLAVLGWADAAKPSIVLPRLTAGRRLIRADYGGTAEHLPLIVEPAQSPPLRLMVRAAPTLTVSSSQNPTGAGQTLTLTARLSGSAGVPRGSVTFRDGDLVLAADVALDATGSAAFTTSALTSGLRVIVVNYPGDALHAATAAQFDQQVEPTSLQQASVAIH
jgi:hypothetical protein